MSASQEPVDPKQDEQKPDTSEQLEVNEEQQAQEAAGQPDEGLVQFGAAEGENLEAMLKNAQEEIARYHDELLRAHAEIENVRR
ncbi:MAG TPA: nucleotide exchange factor GrpE, partial [Burkholderiaceae bacterium]|nr:nucleotide exchange factor GrpE [Burkholderiaceae bacterium]